jgi:hypothetical protein
MHLLPLTAEKKQKEWKIIQHIATKNNFPQNLLQKLKQQILHKDHPQKTNDSHKIWTTFTYYSPQIHKVTNLFKNTNIRIAFRSTNTIKRLLKRKTPPQTMTKAATTNSDATPATRHTLDKQNAA